MTESQVSLPRVSHLSSDSLVCLRARLVDDLQTQLSTASQQEATARQLEVHRDIDSVLERELAVAAAARAREAIGEIEDALERVSAGTYGSCEACRGPIPLERLEAIPHARLCVACHGRHDGSVLLSASMARR